MSIINFFDCPKLRKKFGWDDKTFGCYPDNKNYLMSPPNFDCLKKISMVDLSKVFLKE